MTKLTSKQRAHLRGLANRIKPVIHIGSEGITDALLRSTAEAFNTRELLKVKAQEAAPVHIRELAQQIAAGMEDVYVVQTIGRTAVLYRQDPDDPEIRLPGQKAE
jgi:RNA-binding protein